MCKKEIISALLLAETLYVAECYYSFIHSNAPKRTTAFKLYKLTDKFSDEFTAAHVHGDNAKMQKYILRRVVQLAINVMLKYNKTKISRDRYLKDVGFAVTVFAERWAHTYFAVRDDAEVNDVS